MLDTVLAQISGLAELPDTNAGKELSQKLGPMVEKLSQYLPDLLQIQSMKKHQRLKTENDLKTWLSGLAHDLDEAMEIIKMGKALQK